MLLPQGGQIGTYSNESMGASCGQTYSKEITGSWSYAIECSSDNNMGKSKAFLQAVSDTSVGITVPQFARGLYRAGLQVIALKVDLDARS